MGLGTLRNKPCPCGSGLKAKYCCLPTLYIDEKDRVCKERAEAEDKHVTRKLMKIFEDFDFSPLQGKDIDVK